MLDARGLIVSVNDAWHLLACSNPLIDPEYGVGLDYPTACDEALETSAVDGRKVAWGIRAVLAGTVPRHSLEYPCQSPIAPRRLAKSTENPT